MEGRVFRNNYKGHTDKTKGVRVEAREGGGFGWGGGSGGEKMQANVIEQQ